ncbi:hypothetical protein ACH4TC_18610 [Streptomyces spororaveus]
MLSGRPADELVPVVGPVVFWRISPLGGEACRLEPQHQLDLKRAAGVPA